MEEVKTDYGKDKKDFVLRALAYRIIQISSVTSYMPTFEVGLDYLQVGWKNKNDVIEVVDLMDVSIFIRELDKIKVNYKVDKRKKTITFSRNKL